MARRAFASVTFLLIGSMVMFRVKTSRLHDFWTNSDPSRNYRSARLKN